MWPVFVAVITDSAGHLRRVERDGVGKPTYVPVAAATGMVDAMTRLAAYIGAHHSSATARSSP